MSEQPAVRVMIASDAESAARTLAAAFRTDPSWSWIFGEPVPALALRARFWAQFVRAALANGGGRVADDGAAVALWVPPGAPELLAADEADAERLAIEVMGERGRQMGAVYAAFDEHRPQQEHQYLDLLATHPDHRGRGVGMALLAADLDDLDAIGRPAYLESSNPANLGRYESVGFRRLGSFPLPYGGPTIDTMWRDPR